MTEPTSIVLSSPDAGNRGAGEILRLAREAQHMTLEGLASTIKVTPAKLEALEQGQYDRLPDANFTRALAMTVCRALKLDPTEVLAALPAARRASRGTSSTSSRRPTPRRCRSGEGGAGGGAAGDEGGGAADVGVADAEAVHDVEVSSSVPGGQLEEAVGHRVPRGLGGGSVGIGQVVGVDVELAASGHRSRRTGSA